MHCGVPVTGPGMTREFMPNVSAIIFSVMTSAGVPLGQDLAVAHRDQVMGAAAGLVDVVPDQHDGAPVS